jgi:acetyl-CoA C-acetyltransferase
VHPVDLLAEVLTALFDRTGADPGKVGDVIVGCVAQVGAQAWNIGRNAWLSAGLPEHVPAVTIDRQCGSSQQSVQFAVNAIRAGDYPLAVAAGVEVMSAVPLNISGSPDLGLGYPFAGQGWNDRYGDQEIHQLRGGDLIADRWEVEDGAMRELALRSHQRAAAAWDEGRFDSQIVSVAGVTRDEGIRAGSTLEAMAALKPNRPDGRHTAALSSQIADGASALLLASGEAVRELGLTPLAKIVAGVAVGSDPVLILTGPIPATQALLARTEMSIDQIDLFECNEAFAAVVLAWAKDTGADLDRTNVNGGAMAIGHPLGASGARLMTTLVHELQRTGGRYGLQTMCEGGGLANATLLERV